MRNGEWKSSFGFSLWKNKKKKKTAENNAQWAEKGVRKQVLFRDALFVFTRTYASRCFGFRRFLFGRGLLKVSGCRLSNFLSTLDFLIRLALTEALVRGVLFFLGIVLAWETSCRLIETLGDGCWNLGILCDGSEKDGSFFCSRKSWLKLVRTWAVFESFSFFATEVIKICISTISFWVCNKEGKFKKKKKNTNRSVKFGEGSNNKSPWTSWSE